MEESAMIYSLPFLCTEAIMLCTFTLVSLKLTALKFYRFSKERIYLRFNLAILESKTNEKKPSRRNFNLMII